MLHKVLNIVFFFLHTTFSFSVYFVFFVLCKLFSCGCTFQTATGGQLGMVRFGERRGRYTLLYDMFVCLWFAMSPKLIQLMKEREIRWRKLMKSCCFSELRII